MKVKELIPIGKEILNYYLLHAYKTHIVGSLRRLEDTDEIQLIYLNTMEVNLDGLKSARGVIKSGDDDYFIYKSVPVKAKRIFNDEIYGTELMRLTGPEPFFEIMIKDRQHGGLMPSYMIWDKKHRRYKHGTYLVPCSNEKELFEVMFGFVKVPAPAIRKNIISFDAFMEFNENNIGR